jgi:hypothetical protein
MKASKFSEAQKAFLLKQGKDGLSLSLILAVWRIMRMLENSPLPMSPRHSRRPRAVGHEAIRTAIGRVRK